MPKSDRGGRRAGQITAATVSKGGQSVDYYFQRVNGINYFSRELNGVPEPIPGNLTKEQLLKKAAAGGSTVTRIPSAELKRRQAEYKKQKEETERILNNAYLQDKQFVKGSKMQRIADRQRKRRR